MSSQPTFWPHREEALGVPLLAEAAVAMKAREARYPGRMVLQRLALVLAFVAVGCSSSDDYPAGPLPIDASTVTSLHVTQTGTPPSPTYVDAGAPSVDVTVTNVGMVRAIFDETASLPPVPDGIHHCRADYGVMYHLAFSGTAGSLTFDIDPTGCEVVTVNGVPRSETSGAPAYWNDLQKALGVVIWPATN